MSTMKLKKNEYYKYKILEAYIY